jgi:hypothetical protein
MHSGNKYAHVTAQVTRMLNASAEQVFAKSLV